MPVVFLTGANRGIGFEFARQYAAEGWRVIAAVRDPARADALRELPGKIEIHALDVTDFDAASRLGETLRDEAIDVLIANAGVSGPREMSLHHVADAAWAEVFLVNAMAPLAIAGALRTQVARSAQGGTAAPVLPPDSVAGMRRVIAGLSPHDTGGFFDYSGAALPW